MSVSTPSQNPPLNENLKTKKDINRRGDTTIRDINKFLEDDKWMEE